jgi:eukaryotic-like serine/threonine-protein kinase
MEPEKLGRYRVLSPIGHGGMGTVYLGEHELLHHRVAIKILHERHLHNPAMERRFYNEARAIAALEHPGTVKLFDIGRAGDGRAYVVMELLRGETLRTRIGSRGVPLASALSFAVQISSAMAAAHQKGIVHRDLKPENVFIVRDPDVGSGERVKILDFGIAKRTRIGGTPGPEITRTGMLVGTPSYMAPEQCRGDEQIDARADIYSFGILLYEMLSGVLPFSSANTEEIIAQQLYCAPRPLAQLARGTPQPVIEVVDRCLAKAPADRFPSMAEVGAALRSLAPTDEWELTTAPPVPPTDDDTPDFETLPRSFEDHTTGLAITSLRTLHASPWPRRVVLGLGAVATALAITLLIVRGLLPSASAAATSSTEAGTEPEPRAEVAEPPPEPAAEVAEPAPEPAAEVAEPAPVAAAPAQKPTSAPQRVQRPSQATPQPARKATRGSAKPARAARNAPPRRESPQPETGDPFAQVETPTVF